VHWQGKFRGPDFAPINFILKTVTNDRLKDSKGRKMPTVVASYLSPAGHEELAAEAQDKERKLLKAINDNEGASLAKLAQVLGWTTKDGEPYKMMVQRTLKKLEKQKLVEGTTITPKGKKVLKGGG
jgi:hypothetical protein